MDQNSSETGLKNAVTNLFSKVSDILFFFAKGTTDREKCSMLQFSTCTALSVKASLIIETPDRQVTKEGSIIYQFVFFSLENSEQQFRSLI